MVDEYSLEVLPDNVRMAQENYLAELGVALENPMNLAEVDEADYDLIFYPGGHGPMEDLAYDQDSAKLIQEMEKQGLGTKSTRASIIDTLYPGCSEQVALSA